ncbi:MAG: polysaccharide deacetylase family protein [Lysobacterales bacterium]
MVITEEDSVQYSGIRERLGELCYGSGLLRVLQRTRSWVRQDLRILAYHRVLTVQDSNAFDFDLDLVSTSADGFREQMQLLQRDFSPTALGDVIAALDAGTRLPTNAVVVTFDDGYDDNYRVAYPILRELGVPATFFVSTSHIDSGRPFGYDWLVHMILRAPVQRLVLPELDLDLPMPPLRAERRQLASQVLRRMKGFGDAVQSSIIGRLERDWQMPSDAGHPDCRPMSWDALREMKASGFEIGSHGVGHCMLAKLPPEQLEAELVESRAALERELGEPAILLSYPVGGDLAFDRRVMEATMAAGYQAACSYICGTNPQSALNRYALHRLPVERVMGTGWFAAMLTLPELMGYPTVSRIGKSEQVHACSY